MSMNIISSIIFYWAVLWVACWPLSYMMLKANLRKHSSKLWDHGDQVFALYVSLILGPIVLMVCIIPWERIFQPIADWLRKPTRW